MKQTYLIIGASLTIILLIAIWVYLLIYGTPKPVENFFTDFSFSGNSENISDIPFIPPVPEDQVDVSSTVKLRQLTTKAVIGFGEKTENNETYVLYTEAGTGHVYSINMKTGAEIRLSNITVTNPESAEFSPNGNLVAIRSGFNTQNTIKLISLQGENSATEESLIPKMVDFTFNSKSELLYTEYSSIGLLGRKLNLKTKVSSSIFSVPFQNATIVWSRDNVTNHFVYPKPAASLTGFLYRIENGTIMREQISGGGLNVLANSDYLVHTITTPKGPISFTMKRSDKTVTSMPVLALADKCVFSVSDTNVLFCGSNKENLTYEFPDNWYKGLIIFSDKLYKIDIKKGIATQLSNPELETGRELDIINMKINSTGTVLYFINKNDNTLWSYEI